MSQNPRPEEGFDAVKYARAVLDHYGLHGWTVRWDRAKRRAGCCYHSRREITLSRTLARLYPEDAMRNVVLHEVAHALAGAKHGHDAHWKKLAVRVGAEPRALLPPNLPQPAATWVGTCPHCGLGKSLHAAPRRVVSCGRCSSSFSREHILEWRHHGKKTVPGGNYERELRRIRRR
ncbi:SprT-like domain-containing protein [Actinomyces minihominis]|uniref:SprT-like domain-containing protein n=1 Tax=Actinomyces minihominis TaxID=2002838 RepID=UPI001F5D7B94|nr:SprT-like domain-containing protein [Actinomyces minihominis]